MNQNDVIDCGQRLGKLSLSQLSEATQKYGLGRCWNAVPIEAGNFKQNVSLVTDQGEWIFRGRSHYTWQFPKERFFAHLLGRETAAPVPLPYFVDESLEIFGYDYVLMPKMPGLQLSNQAQFNALSPLDKKSIAFELGRFLHDLQACKRPTFGVYKEEVDDIVSYPNAYSKEVTLRAQDYIERSNSTAETLAPGEVDIILEMLNEYLPQIDSAQTVCVMQDYKDGNMCVSKIDKHWKVTGLFDLMEARFGHPLEDLPRQYAAYLDAQHPECAAAFLTGYGLKDENVSLFNLFMILDRLVVWEFGVRVGKWWSDGETFLDWVERYSLFEVPVFGSKLEA